MKNYFQSTLSLIAAIGLSLAGALPALADSATQSFQTTNFVNTGVQYSTYPTNANFVATGVPIDVSNYRITGLYISGDLVNSNASIIGLKIPRSFKAVVSGSTTNWETVPQYNIIIPVPVGTNHFVWGTNLVEDCVAPATAIGLAGLTNNFTTGCSLTNFDAGIVKKIVPNRFP
jgi:hypothetical protein